MHFNEVYVVGRVDIYFLQMCVFYFALRNTFTIKQNTFITLNYRYFLIRFCANFDITSGFEEIRRFSGKKSALYTGIVAKKRERIKSLECNFNVPTQHDLLRRKIGRLGYYCKAII